jgi:hypothetical protein
MSRRVLALMGGLGLIAVVGVLLWAAVPPVRQDAAAPLIAAPLFAADPSPHADPTAASSTPGAPTAIASTLPSTGSAAADPFVQKFAQQPGVKPLKPLPSPTARLSMPANVDGCDRAYGEPAQCIPSAFPAGTTDKCGWLAAHGFTAVKVVGRDRQKLDPDGNRIACDA